jgi:dipeptidyl aminopeptidase/acylaminoacyl peptidase
MRTRSPAPIAVITVLLAAVAVACGDSAGPEDRIVEGVNFTELFAPPTSAEIDAVLADWAGRDVSAQGVRIEVSATVAVSDTQAVLQVVSHTVGGARHYGAVLAPVDAQPGSLPVLMYTHGGDGGVDVDGLLPLLPLLLGGLEDRFVFVAPSFRSEPLIFGGTTYMSEGEPSPWDRDVDDALALLNVVAGVAPAADTSRVGIVGFSRGAAVAMLMAERDPGIDLVVEFFGPTDFFGPFVQDVVEEALRGTPRDLPGLDFLNERFIQPLKRGELTIAQMRLEILRRSPVYFAERLPQLQVHHGTADEIVPVGEAERLIEVMQGLGRGPPEFEFFIYEGGTHNPLTLTGSLDQAQAFLGRLFLSLLAF